MLTVLTLKTRHFAHNVRAWTHTHVRTCTCVHVYYKII